MLLRITDQFGNFGTSQETDVFLESDYLKVPRLNLVYNTSSLLVLSFNVLIAAHFVYCLLFVFYREACSHNLKARVKGFFFGFLGLLLPVVLLINFLASSSARGTLNGLVGKEVAEKLHMYTVSTTASNPSVCCVVL